MRVLPQVYRPQKLNNLRLKGEHHNISLKERKFRNHIIRRFINNFEQLQSQISKDSILKSIRIYIHCRFYSKMPQVKVDKMKWRWLFKNSHCRVAPSIEAVSYYALCLSACLFLDTDATRMLPEAINVLKI